MPLFTKPLVYIDFKSKQTRGDESDFIQMLNTFMEFFDNGFVPAYDQLTQEDKDKLIAMFNGLLDEHNSLGDMLGRCDKDELEDKFTELTSE